MSLRAADEPCEWQSCRRAAASLCKRAWHLQVSHSTLKICDIKPLGPNPDSDGLSISYLFCGGHSAGLQAWGFIISDRPFTLSPLPDRNIRKPVLDPLSPKDQLTEPVSS